MLKWCAWCHQFMHEIAPYDDFSITDGLCAACEYTHKNPFAKNVVDRANFLGELFHALFDAGRHEDFKAAAGIVENAISADCRPVDILLGMFLPCCTKSERSGSEERLVSKPSIALRHSRRK
jgi:hypothetical protein